MALNDKDWKGEGGRNWVGVKIGGGRKIYKEQGGMDGEQASAVLLETDDNERRLLLL